MEVFVAVVALGGVVLIGVVLQLLGATQDGRVDEASARARWALDEPDAVIDEVVVDAQGRGAVGVGPGDVLLAWVVGDGVVVRRWATIAARAEGDTLVVTPGELTLREVRLEVPDAAAWADRIGTGREAA